MPIVLKSICEIALSKIYGAIILRLFNCSSYRYRTYSSSSKSSYSINRIYIYCCLYFLLAFYSIIGNYYYGESNLEFMCNSKVVLNIFRVIVVGMVMFGSLTKVEGVWNLADLFMALMAIINLIAIVMIGKFVFINLKDYEAQKKVGIKDPVFNSYKMKYYNKMTFTLCGGLLRFK